MLEHNDLDTKQAFDGQSSSAIENNHAASIASLSTALPKLLTTSQETEATPTQHSSHEHPLMTKAPIEDMSAVQVDHARHASSSRIESPAVLPPRQNSAPQLIEEPYQQAQIFNSLSAQDHFPMQMDYAAPTSSSSIGFAEMSHTRTATIGRFVDGVGHEEITFSLPPVQYRGIEDMPYTGLPVVFKLQFFKNFQIRLLRCHPTGREYSTWKTSDDQYPWSTTLVVPVGGHDVVLLRRVSDIDDFINLRYPDSGRLSNMFPARLPPTPSEILANWDYFQAHVEDRYHPDITDRDNPLKALYRIYATIMLDYNHGMRMELEYFCRRPSWRVHKIPDPKDPDPARYAMLAATTGILVLSFNARIKIGLHRDTGIGLSDEERDRERARKKKWESVPKWAKRVPPLKDTLWLPEVTGNGVQGPEDPNTCIPFKEKNILLKNPHFYFT